MTRQQLGEYAGSTKRMCVCEMQTSGGAEAKVPGAEQITQECPVSYALPNPSVCHPSRPAASSIIALCISPNSSNESSDLVL